MVSFNNSIVGFLTTAALSGCIDSTQLEGKSYHITLKVGNRVATIIANDNAIMCTKNLDNIPRVFQITRGEDLIQLKEGVLFNGAGFNARRTADGRYTIIASQLPEDNGGGVVARIINKGGNGTKVITQKEGEDLCRK